MSTSYSVDGRVAVIRIDNPPVNGLGHATREGISRDLRRALDDAKVDAVVLTGRPGFFSAGADITEFGTPKSAADPNLPAVIAAVEGAGKPVVAAIDGTAFGGGLELALGAHYRVATAASKVGLPEVTLGIVPGAGGTQRLPRVLPAPLAAEMITSGAPRSAAELGRVVGQRLFDRIVEGDVVAAATAFAAEVAATRPLPRVRDLAVEAGDARRARRAAHPADAPRARTSRRRWPRSTSWRRRSARRSTTGSPRNARSFVELVGSDQSAALRHAFFAERTARKIPDIPAGTTARPVDRVGIVGAGTMGGGIAMNFLNVGIPVTIVETAQDALDRGLGVIRKNYQIQVDRGKLAAADLERRMALLSPGLDLADLAGCDLVIEAVFEDMDVKRDVFARLDQVAKPGAVLATNTSTLDVDRIAAATRRPADVVGMHFFSPANVMKLLEVVRGKETADDVLVTAMAVGQRIGKTCVVARVCDGFIGNRMLGSYRDAAYDLLRRGATPADIDGAVEGFGFAMGPFRMGDLAGNDIGWAIRKRRYAEHPDLPREEIADALCELGRFGQKTGAGWYDYEGRDAVPSPVVDDLLADYWRRNGVQRTAFDPQEIVQRLVFALADAGARILEEGIALRASDIDVVYLAGYGFPRHEGGPMFHANRVGLPTVLAALRRFNGDDWRPAPLLVKLAGENGTFA